MTKKGGRTTVKRQLAPTFWDINRKEGRFIPRIHPAHIHKNMHILGDFTRCIKGHKKYARSKKNCQCR
jgi:ribosomal protein S4E